MWVVEIVATLLVVTLILVGIKMFNKDFEKTSVKTKKFSKGD